MRTPQILILTICLALAAIACSSEEGDTDTTSSPTTTTTVAPPTTTTSRPPTTTAENALSTEDTLAVADAYFAENSAGDFEALRALFVADPAFTGSFGIADDEQLFAWNVAQGTTISPPECTLLDGDTMAVNCQTFNHDAIVQAVDGPPVPIRLKLTITLDGIVEENGFFGQPDFNTVGEPFESWMTENHPEIVDSLEFGNWASIEEAQENGRLTAH